MPKEYHILNGDALKEQFPRELSGEVIVARECLVDGPVGAKSLEELYQTRARYLSENYGGTEQDYHKHTVTEFKKVLEIEDGGIINLWFEDDLFCQVNFWFVASLLTKYNKQNQVYLVRPETHTQYGFGGLNAVELVEEYKQRVALKGIDEIVLLWEAYQQGEIATLLEKAKKLALTYPFILPAAQAHIDRIPKNGGLGRAKESIRVIMAELETEEFAPVFLEFTKRESIYGFGDLQVKKLFEEVKEQ